MNLTFDVRDFYYNYMGTTDNPISEREYSAILMAYGKVLRDIALDTGTVQIKKLGVQIDLVKVSTSRKMINHDRTTDYSNPVYHMNYHTDGFVCKIDAYVQLVKHFRQRRDYVFKKHEDFKHGFRDKLKTRSHIYPIKIGDKI